MAESRVHTTRHSRHGDPPMKLGLLILIYSQLSFAGSTKQKIRVYLDWFPNVEFAGMYVAMKNGFYEREGIEVEPVFTDLDIIPRVLRGEADIGLHSAHDLIRHRAEGAPIKAFAAKYQLNPNSIIVGEESGIHSVKDLKGKTLAVFSPQETDMYRIMLQNSNLKLTDVKFKKVTTFKETELIDLLKKHEVDGMIAWEFNWTLTFALLGYPVHVFPGYENGFHFYGITYFAKEDYIASHRDLLRKFLRATFEGWREVYKDPEKHAEYVVENKFPKDRYINGSKELTLKQQKLELRLRKKYFFQGVSSNRLGAMSAFHWQRSLEIAKTSGMIPASSTIKATDLFDSTVWNPKESP